MYIQPYLFFDGRCQEALDYYVSALGAKVEMLMKFKDSPEPPDPKHAPASGDNVMHASFRIGDSVVMASDGFGKGKPVFQGKTFSVVAYDRTGQSFADLQAFNDAIERAAKVVSDDIRTRVAAYFATN